MWSHHGLPCQLIDTVCSPLHGQEQTRVCSSMGQQSKEKEKKVWNWEYPLLFPKAPIREVTGPQRVDYVRWDREARVLLSSFSLSGKCCEHFLCTLGRWGVGKNHFNLINNNRREIYWIFPKCWVLWKYFASSFDFQNDPKKYLSTCCRWGTWVSETWTWPISPS